MKKREESGSVPQLTDPDAPKTYLRIRVQIQIKIQNTALNIDDYIYHFYA